MARTRSHMDNGTCGVNISGQCGDLACGLPDSEQPSCIIIVIEKCLPVTVLLRLQEACVDRVGEGGGQVVGRLVLVQPVSVVHGQGTLEARGQDKLGRVGLPRPVDDHFVLSCINNTDQLAVRGENIVREIVDVLSSVYVDGLLVLTILVEDVELLCLRGQHLVDAVVKNGQL